MNDNLRIILTGDGPSDRSLLPLIVHLLTHRIPTVAIQAEWADLSRLRQRPKTVKERLRLVIDVYPSDIIFIHRDAEREPYTKRFEEINDAVIALGAEIEIPVVPVVPVRMQEAWLLHDEMAIRKAAGNPNGRISLSLPNSARVETDPDAKQTLHDLLRTASGLSGRRLDKLGAPRCALLVSEYMTEFQPLYAIPAFRRLAEDIDRIISMLENTLPSSDEGSSTEA